MIRVLVVDDSAVAREFITHVVNRTGDMTVIGTAANGLEAVEAAERLQPDIITMDIMMPLMDGPTAIDIIMNRCPRPIVVVTSNTITEEVRATFRSLESGALAIVPRPPGSGSPEHVAATEHLVQTIRLMSEVKVVRRLRRREVPPTPAPNARIETRPRGFRVVAIGASTGGPSALKTVLSTLRRTFPVPMLVVQHIAPGFVDGFITWLRDSTSLTVQLAETGQPLAPGTVYIAPDGAHLTVGVDERIILKRPARLGTGMLCPSAHELFLSVADVYRHEAAGVLLTGMGRDGADGLLSLKRAGALTIAQDKASSVVHGMPGEAIALGAADFILPPEKIGALLTTFAAAAYPLTH